MKTQARLHRRLKGNERLNYSEWRERYRDMSDPLNRGLVFALPMFEGSGTVLDCALPRHSVALVNGPTWTQLASGQRAMYFDGKTFPYTFPFEFGGDPDNLICTSCPVLNFTSGEFSACVWVNATSIETIYLICRGVQNLHGWGLMLENLVAYVETNQAGARQRTAGTTTTSGNWRCIGFSRRGASVCVYENGNDDTSIAASHTDPLTSTSNLVLAAYYDSTDSPLTGCLGKPHIWNRSLSASEHREFYERYRGLFGI